uniref:(northern house mosquito) hypothetical protein n=1 Tax=Culex pipiens TaxID=7175 RepID=A0A8D8FIY9_CULPI
MSQPVADGGSVLKWTRHDTNCDYRYNDRAKLGNLCDMWQKHQPSAAAHPQEIQNENHHPAVYISDRNSAGHRIGARPQVVLCVRHGFAYLLHDLRLHILQPRHGVRRRRGRFHQVQ